jgi:DNA-binding CsgD family transcriptional regulator
VPARKTCIAFPSCGLSDTATGGPGFSLLPSSAWSVLSAALRLSSREMQIVQGVFDDQKEEVIAYELGISPHTVNTYCRRLYGKLRVSSRPQLIVRVIAEYLALAGDRHGSAPSDELRTDAVAPISVAAPRVAVCAL